MNPSTIDKQKLLDLLRARLEAELRGFLASQNAAQVTPGSPIGQALMGRQVDDEIALDLPGRRLVATIAWIC